MIPTRMPGAASGNVTVKKVAMGPAPNVEAANSNRRSTISNDSRIARSISGNAITAAASAAPVQRKENVIPSQS